MFDKLHLLVSDNNVLAERPVLASYPFGTAARPVPTKGPPGAKLTLHTDADPGLSEEELAGKLPRHIFRVMWPIRSRAERNRTADRARSLTDDEPTLVAWLRLAGTRGADEIAAAIRSFRAS